MPNPDEPPRQHMQQEATQELIDGESEQPLLVFMGGVAPAERDLMAVEGNEAMIRDSHAMGVGAEIPQHLIGSAEWRLAIHHPSNGEQLTDEALKHSGL